MAKWDNPDVSAWKPQKLTDVELWSKLRQLYRDRQNGLISEKELNVGVGTLKDNLPQNVTIAVFYDVLSDLEMSLNSYTPRDWYNLGRLTRDLINRLIHASYVNPADREEYRAYLVSVHTGTYRDN